MSAPERTIFPLSRRHAENRQCVASCLRTEENFRDAPDESSNFVPRLLDRAAGSPAFRMHGRGVSKEAGCLFHGSPDLGIQNCGGVVVEIDHQARAPDYL